jgi:hypothetical protein
LNFDRQRLGEINALVDGRKLRIFKQMLAVVLVTHIFPLLAFEWRSVHFSNSENKKASIELNETVLFLKKKEVFES